MKSSVSYAVMSSICALIVGLLLILWPDVAVNYLGGCKLNCVSKE